MKRPGAGGLFFTSQGDSHSETFIFCRSFGKMEAAREEEFFYKKVCLFAASL